MYRLEASLPSHKGISTKMIFLFAFEGGGGDTVSELCVTAGSSKYIKESGTPFGVSFFISNLSGQETQLNQSQGALGATIRLATLFILGQSTVERVRAHGRKWEGGTSRACRLAYGQSFPKELSS